MQNSQETISFNIRHISDLHYCPGHLAEADKCVEASITHNENVHLWVISGDTTHYRLYADMDAYIQLVKRVGEMADLAPVFILQGTFSHEPLGFLEIFKTLNRKYPIWVSENVELITLKDNFFNRVEHQANIENADILICSLPTLNKADVIAMTNNLSSVDDDAGDAVHEVLKGFKPYTDQALKHNVPSILISHGTVAESMTEHGVPMAGKDHEYTLASLYGAGADAVLLGHIHKHQAWNRTFQGRYQVIAYPGSPGRYHFGEIGNKYFLNWYLKSNCAEFAAIETPAQIMHSISFSGAPDLDELFEAAKQSTGKAVKISFSIDEEHNAAVDRLGIEKMFLDAGATEVKIIGNVLPIQRQRAPGISTASLEERLKKWLGQTGTDSTGIFERYEMLISKDPEVIVNELLSQI